MHLNVVVYRYNEPLYANHYATPPVAGLHVDRVAPLYMSKRIVRERVARDGADSGRQFHIRSAWLLLSSLCAVSA